MDDFRPIARAGRLFWGCSSAIFVMVLGAVVAALVSYTSGALAMSALVAALFLAASLWWVTGRRWRSWGYAERERDLLVRNGVLIRRLVVVPYGRMQFIEVRQGPIDRLFGCASVRLHTAAAATDAHIPWLMHEEADRLRAHLTELGEAHAAGL